MTVCVIHNDDQNIIDSAVPCAIMLNMVKTTLPTLKRLLEGKNLGLMLIFFDGEEAFVNWNDQVKIFHNIRIFMKIWNFSLYLRNIFYFEILR